MNGRIVGPINAQVGKECSGLAWPRKASLARAAWLGLAAQKFSYR